MYTHTHIRVYLFERNDKVYGNVSQDSSLQVPSSKSLYIKSRQRWRLSRLRERINYIYIYICVWWCPDERLLTRGRPIKRSTIRAVEHCCSVCWPSLRVWFIWPNTWPSPLLTGVPPRYRSVPEAASMIVTSHCTHFLHGDFMTSIVSCKTGVILLWQETAERGIRNVRYILKFSLISTVIQRYILRAHVVFYRFKKNNSLKITKVYKNKLFVI